MVTRRRWTWPPPPLPNPDLRVRRVALWTYSLRCPSKWLAQGIVMNAEQLTAALDAALADRQLLDHPFYLRWEAGKLEPGDDVVTSSISSKALPPGAQGIRR